MAVGCAVGVDFLSDGRRHGDAADRVEARLLKIALIERPPPSSNAGAEEGSLPRPRLNVRVESGVDVRLTPEVVGKPNQVVRDRLRRQRSRLEIVEAAHLIA